MCSNLFYCKSKYNTYFPPHPFCLSVGSIVHFRKKVTCWVFSFAKEEHCYRSLEKTKSFNHFRRNNFQSHDRRRSPSAPHKSFFNFHCHVNIFCRSIPPSPRSSSFLSIVPSLPPTPAQGCQSFRDPVSCEIAQIAVALRLAQQQRGT